MDIRTRTNQPISGIINLNGLVMMVGDRIDITKELYEELHNQPILFLLNFIFREEENEWELSQDCCAIKAQYSDDNSKVMLIDLIADDGSLYGEYTIGVVHNLSPNHEYTLSLSQF